MYYNFLMVSTVFSKKQFTIVPVREEELSTLTQLSKGRNHLILFPLLTKQNIRDVSDLISTKMRKQLVDEILEDYPHAKDGRPLCLKFGKFQVKNVLSIEHLQDNFFRVRTKEGSFISDSFEFFV